MAAGSRVATMGSLSLHPEPGLTQPSILSWSVNEYRLWLGRFKAGMCDGAWCAQCTWAPLRFDIYLELFDPL